MIDVEVDQTGEELDNMYLANSLDCTLFTDMSFRLIQCININKELSSIHQQ